MKFSGHEVPLNLRSGLELTPEGPLHAKGSLDLQFHLKFDPDHESYFGYIFRMIVGGINIDLVHGEVRENPNNFELIIGDRTSEIAFSKNVDSLTEQWLHLQFHLDLRNLRITALVDGKELKDELAGLDAKEDVRLMFGAHSFGNFSSTDVPPMIIRDVKINWNGNRALHWVLDETEGTVVRSNPTGNNGVAMNPDWLLKHHNTWKKILDLPFADTIKSCFDGKNEELYLVGPDSIYVYHIKNDSLRIFARPGPSYLNRSNNILFDTIRDRLTVYSIDNDYMICLDPGFNRWADLKQGNESLTNYWHHNRFFSPDGNLTVLGGYGYHTYKSELLEWNPSLDRFEEVAYTGEFYPRYLAGTGFNPLDSMIYVIGGYGSKSGKQSVSPDYYYEILRYDREERKFTRINEFNEREDGFCFSNSVVFDNANNLYGLHYSKYNFDNRLQLVKISLEDTAIMELGDPIPYRFIDVNSYSDIIYSDTRDALVSLSSYTSNDSTYISLYTIAFPPQAFSSSEPVESSTGLSRPALYLAAVILILIAVLLVYLLRKRRTKDEPAILADTGESPKRQKENAIYLFGGFQVFDNQGKDITGQFTPLPKKLFIYILLNTLRNEKGVSSKSLNETFWFDKSEASARNNRAVNIVKLKSLLESLDTVFISKDSGYWKFDFDPSIIYIDYYKYLQLVHPQSHLTRDKVTSLLSIIENRPFLNNTDAEWLDPFKSEVSNEIIDAFIRYIRSSPDDPEFLLHLTNCIFMFDSVSEEALKLQCRLLIKQGKHSLAKSAYTKFVNEYKHLYDEEYRLDFQKVLGE